MRVRCSDISKWHDDDGISLKRAFECEVFAVMRSHRRKLFKKYVQTLYLMVFPDEDYFEWYDATNFETIDDAMPTWWIIDEHECDITIREYGTLDNADVILRYYYYAGPEEIIKNKNIMFDLLDYRWCYNDLCWQIYIEHAGITGVYGSLSENEWNAIRSRLSAWC